MCQPDKHVTNYRFETHAGWPPDGEPGLFFGFDGDWNAAVLMWIDGRWTGVRFQHDLRRPTPQAFQRGEGSEHFVVCWARAPLCEPAVTTGEQRP